MALEATAALRFESPVSMWSAAAVPAANCLKSSSSSGFVLKKVCVETPRKCRPQLQGHGEGHALPQSDPDKELAFHGFVNLFSVSGMKKFRHMSVLRNAQRRSQRSFSGFSDWLISTAARSLVRAEATSSSPSSIITEARVAVGEEPARGSATHTVTVVDRQRGITHKFDVPEDRYILHTGEDQGKELPFSCRHGCCTACAVRVKSGQLYQPEALGISAELKDQGYALLCVGYALSDLEVETQDEDEVYWLQFGRYFARGPVERDDYALELAMADE